ncbi:glycoside hydrolase family 88 protein [Mucilaginibacter terrae]|uniref:glycoside hydrolase family 88 protein n=1 Tax=Mucilaginibacter terrae TaxID=1955052 RepID=UPI0028999017|nr:glycoside hydrolase family 88 protein [Mucilaginibacter terrae]
METSIKYCQSQAIKTLKQIPEGDENDIPRSIQRPENSWRYVNYKDWCSGFWPGELWLLYEGTKNKDLGMEADRFTRQLQPLVNHPGYDHDLGFQIFNSYGNGYRLTKNEAYKKIILTAADSLAKLFNPKVGTILSWPQNVNKMGPHNTIIDNMINLELLFWASRNGGPKRYYNIAKTHASTTMRNHFRPDFSSYHVVIYDTVSGRKIKGITHQGYSDSSMWARGQSWAIYGFTMCYRETKDPAFLDFAQKVANIYLKKLPKDYIPYWDFDAPGGPQKPRDASAACVTASALLELSTFVKDKVLARKYRMVAEKMIGSLSSPQYQSRSLNPAALMHSTGHFPNGSEIDASIIYADYYYMEALLRLSKLQRGSNLYQPLK